MAKRGIFLIGLIILLVATPLVYSQEEVKEWVVRRGDSLVIKIKGLERVAIGDANIADVTVVSDEEILINGRSKGTTTLHVWTSKGDRIPYRVRVVEKDFPVKEEVNIEELILQMRRIEGLEEVTITPIGDTLVLKGRVKREADREAAVKIASSWAREVVNLIETPPPPAPPPAEPLDVKVLERQIRGIGGLEEISLISIGDTLILKGMVASSEEREACSKIVAPFSKYVVNLIKIKTPVPVPVKPLDLEELTREIRRIEGLEDVSLNMVGDTLILKGRVVSDREREACGRIVAGLTREIVNLIELKEAPPKSEPLPPYEEIRKIDGLEGIEIDLLGENLILRGMVKDQQDKDKAENLAKAVHPRVINLIEVTSPIQVLVKLQLIQIRKDALKRLGIDWSITHKDQNVTTKLDVKRQEPLPETFNIGIVRNSPEEKITEIDLVLELLQRRGELQVLSSPTLVTRSDKEAYVNMGGKIPIPVTTVDATGSRTTAIEWVEYGIQLKITPHVDRLENIDLVIDSSVSELDWENKVLGYPALLEKKIITQISSRNKDTIIISGLVGSSKTSRINKVPYLGDIPILGLLFTSKEFQEDKTELVVLITPQIVTPIDFKGISGPDVIDQETSRAARLKNEVLPLEEAQAVIESTREIKKEIETKERDKVRLKPEVVTEKKETFEKKEIKPEPPTEMRETPKLPESKTLRMVVELHPSPSKERIQLYVQLENVSLGHFYVSPSYFLLKTRDGDRHNYSFYAYTTRSPFFGRHLESGGKAEGYLVFDTEETPDQLVYDDGAGNTAYWKF